jgi:hypothetical protein
MLLDPLLLLLLCQQHTGAAHAAANIHTSDFRRVQ